MATIEQVASYGLRLAHQRGAIDRGERLEVFPGEIERVEAPGEEGVPVGAVVEQPVESQVEADHEARLLAVARRRSKEEAVSGTSAPSSSKRGSS